MTSKALMNIYFKSPRFIQTAGINIFELTTTWINTKRPTYTRWVRLLYESEKWKKEDFKKYQTKYLRYIVEYAYKHVPFYHKLYKEHKIHPSSIRTLNDLEKLPIITKDDIRDNNAVFSTKREKYVKLHTSGTTGKPLHLRVSTEAYLLSLAAAYHGRRYPWANYDGGYVARFVGDTPVKDCGEKVLYRISHITKRVIFPSYCLSFDTLPKIVDTLRKLNIKYIQAYPSTVYLIAKFIEFQDEVLPLKAVFYSSEPMYDFQRRIIEERFNSKVFGFYGQAENVVSAVECEKGGYHLTMIDGITEIVKDGERASAGEKGFVVATSLHNKAMPLIRYYLGDYTGYVNEECECGRKIPTIYPIETKLEDFIVTPEGRIISPSLLTFPLKYAHGILESQIVQKKIDEIVVKIVKTDKYTEEDEKSLIKSLRELVGQNINIKLEYVDKIHQTKAYKKRFVINELGRDYIEKAFQKIS